jgi:hypothetical protein
MMPGPIDNPYGKPIPPPYGDVKSLSHPSYGDVPVDEPLPKEALEYEKPRGHRAKRGAGKSPPPKHLVDSKAHLSNARLEQLTRPVRQFAGDVAQHIGKVPGASAVGKLASRAAGPAGVAIAAHDIQRGVTDPDFIIGLIDMLGGEEVAYNMWVAQEAKEGRERPSYEEWRAGAEEMVQEGTLEADEIEYEPDAREVAKRALKVRE